MKHFYQNIPGWFSFRGLYEQAVAAAPTPARFVEVGCWKGRSAAFLAVEIINSGKAISLTCVDTWAGSQEKKHQEDPSVINGTLYREFEDNLAPAVNEFKDFPDRYFDTRRMPSVHAAMGFAKESVDFVMVDGAHDYESVATDLNSWWRKIKAGGVMAGDDFHFDAVGAAVREFFGKIQHEIERVPGTGTGVAWRVRKK